MHRLKSNEQGMVSIIISLIIMIILSLITLGFAKIMQREQREALDRQLSTQAFYAAESGVNDAVRAIESGAFTNPQKPDCDVGDGTQPLSVNPARNAGIVDISGTETKVSYTCLIIDQAPKSLEYGDITAAASKIIPVSATTNITDIKISWNDTDASHTNYATTCTGSLFTQVPSWPADRPAMLRVDLIPLDATITRAGVIDRTLNLFLFPATTAAGCVPVNSIDYANHRGAANQGQTIPVSCSNVGVPRQCNLTISNIISPVKNYIVRVRGIYVHNNVSLVITGSNGGTPINLVGAQALIDVTGKANDVLRRIQVRKPLTTFDYNYPEFAIQSSDSICKLMRVAPNFAQTSDTSVADSTTACKIN